MIKRIFLIPIWLSIASILFACGNKNAINNNSGNYSLQSEQTREENHMVHEIVTISKLNESFLVATNDKGDEYVIDEYDKYGIEFSVGQNIGISYTEKAKNDDGTYALCIISITEEGSLTIAPKEK